jgi:hypothetical protein
MRRATKLLLFLSITLLTAGCKLAIVVVEGGEVVSSRSGTCVAGMVCIVNVTDPGFSETFTAVPDTAWRFEKWNSGDMFFCGDSTDPTCTLSFEGHEESESVEKIVASSQVFYLMPVFVPAKPIIDTITAGGKEWAQVDLFFLLLWQEINAICPAPAGVCVDNGTLNGYDMTGWAWASVDDVKALFNGYIGEDVLGPETDFYRDATGQTVERFFDDGWRPTHQGTVRDFEGTQWNVLLSDTDLDNSSWANKGTALIFTLHELFKPENFETAGFSAESDGDADPDNSWRTGALFFRQ